MTTVTAGRLVSAVVYSQALASDSPMVRSAKTRASNEARALINRRTSWQKLEALLAANFDHGDLWVTLTYDDEHIPPRRSSAQNCLDRFIRSLRAARALKGRELRYVKNTETVTAYGEPTRIHHHLVINGTGGDFETIRALWRWGTDVEIKPFGHDGQTYQDVARYMAKERPPVGQNSWTPSRNLARPRRESELVSDCVTLAVPPGATVIDRSERHNGWGEYVYIKYLLPRTTTQ